MDMHKSSFTEYLPEYCVRVDRGTIFGNPFKFSNEDDRDLVCDKYEAMPKSKEYDDAITRLVELYKKHGKLYLYCWCAPERCHAETIRKIILVDYIVDSRLKELEELENGV